MQEMELFTSTFCHIEKQCMECKEVIKDLRKQHVEKEMPVALQSMQCET